MRSERLGQKGQHFLRGEPQISRADLGQVTTRTQACQGKRGISPCRHDQVELRWQMIDEIGDSLMDRWRSDQMVVIQHQRHLVRQGSKFIDPDGQDSFYGWKRRERGCLKEREGGCPETLMNARESREHIGPEACEIIIVLLQRDPGSWKRS